MFLINCMQHFPDIHGRMFPSEPIQQNRIAKFIGVPILPRTTNNNI